MDREIDLVQYLPGITAAVEDFKRITEAENPEVKNLWLALEKALNDEFVQSAADNGVKRWESVLKILPKGTDSLDERKFRILTRLNEQLPYSWRMLARQLTALCGKDGYTMELRNAEYTLIVRVALTAKPNFGDVDSMLRRISPANLVIELTLLYNRHSTLAEFTHAHLSRYTHAALKDEVIK